jgi:AraC family transcriptional activator of pobA
MKKIPLHQILSGFTIGLRMAHFQTGIAQDDDVAALGAHRDDNYIFFVLETGSALIMVDFHEIEIQAPALYYVLPTQVHNRMRNELANGWFIAVDTSLISRECRNVFEGKLLLQSPFLCKDVQLRQFRDLLCLLQEKLEEETEKPFYVPVVNGLLQSFIGMFTGCYSDFRVGDVKRSGLATLASEFKNLLVGHLRTIKSPSAYAAKLNVSESYLNEALKKTTGFPVSYWIQQELMMEAKRLLYYSQLNVKEIAHNLGYEDHSYFSRFFRKVVGMPAVAFREQYRK